MLKLYQLRNPYDRLNGWWVIYSTEEENFITWAFLEKMRADLPEYMIGVGVRHNMGPGSGFEPESWDPQSHRITSYPTQAPDWVHS